MRRLLVLLAAGTFLVSCSASRFVEPVEKGKLAGGVNLGGPLIDFGSAPIPVPLSSLEAGYGLKDNLTIYGGLHTTAMLFGNLQMDLGATYQVLKQNRYIPNISVSPSLNTIWDISDKKIKSWPVLDLNCYWNYGAKKNYFYIGINNYFELSGTRTLDQKQQYPVLLNPQIGHVLKGKDRKWEFTAEIKFLAPYIQNTYSFVPYKSLTGQHGATGIYLGYRRYFNLPSKKN